MSPLETSQENQEAAERSGDETVPHAGEIGSSAESAQGDRTAPGGSRASQEPAEGSPDI